MIVLAVFLATVPVIAATTRTTTTTRKALLGSTNEGAS
jgi:hypothetical protein